VLTRTSNSGVGPCVTERAAIGNDAHADAAINIHADGGPPTGRGFAILEPVADGPNDGIIAPSEVLGLDIRAAFLADTGEPVSTYDGVPSGSSSGVRRRSSGRFVPSGKRLVSYLPVDLAEVSSP
jgi:N-acetylmuramoyl-L-alanine amidase